MKRLELHLLGSFQATLDGEPLTGFSSDKARALLAYLAVEGDKSHRRQHLASLFWGEYPDTSALASLRSVLYNLRQVLAPLLADDHKAQDETPLLTVTRQTVTFNAHHPDCRIDVVTFDELIAAQQVHLHRDPMHCAACIRRMGQAVDLYSGDLLAGFALGDSPAFDQWQTLQREVRHRQTVDILSILTKHYITVPRHDAVERYARRLLELDPWNEEGHRTLMWTRAMSGRRTAALAQYEACRRILQEELGVKPSEATAALYHQIRDGNLGWDAETEGNTEPQNPYKGLQPFDEGDADYFFGREALVDRLLSRLSEIHHDDPLEADGGHSPNWMKRFLAVVGPSGSGKSSVVRAGLIPALRRAGAMDGARWIIVTILPGEDPTRELFAALNTTLPSHPVEIVDEADRVSLQQVISDRLPPDTRLLIFIDQGEELFTLTRDPALRARFVADLLIALRSLDNLWIVATLRADYYDRPLRNPDWSPLFHQRMEITPPLAPEELERAIAAPAEHVGVTLEPGLATRIASDVGAGLGALPLLQYALTELFERREGRLLTFAAYEAMGGLAGALIGRAEALYAGLSGAEQEAARQLFLRLVVPADAARQRHTDARRRVPLGELEGLCDDPETMDVVMKTFGQHRLLTFDRDPTTEEPTVEIAHEVLLMAWPRLQRWLEDSRADIRLHRRLAVAAEEWARADQEPGFLAQGSRLVQFESLLSAASLALTPVESEYVRSSLAERERRRTDEEARQKRERAIEQRSRSRLQALVAVLSVAAVVFLGLMIFALHQRGVAEREAAIAHSLILATGAQLSLNEGNTDTALTLAMEANRIPDPPPQAQLMLADAAYAPGVRSVFLGHDGAVEDVVLTSDGNRALSASADGTLILWDLEMGELVRRFSGHEGAVHTVAFLPSGDRAISASADGTLILWNVETGDVVRRFSGHSSEVLDVAVSPDCSAIGCQAISASADGTLILWDVETGEIVRQFTGHEGAVNCVAISPDARTALSGAADHGLILWDIETGRVIHRLQQGEAQAVFEETLTLGGHEGPVRDAVFGSNGLTAYSVAEDSRMFYWDLESGTPIRVEDLTVGIYSIDLSPDGRYALLGLLDSRVVLWIHYYGQIALDLLGHTGRVEAVAFTPDGLQAVSGAADGSVRLWDLRSGAELRRMEFDGSALNVDLSPDGRLLLMGTWSGDISLWDYERGVEVRRLVGHTEMPFAGALLVGGDARTAVSGAGYIYGAAEDPTVRLWDVETGEEIQRFEGHTSLLWDIDVSADGAFAVSGSHDGTARLWDLNRGTGTVLADVAPQAVRSVAISPDGQTVLIGLAKGTSSAPDYALRLLDRESGELVRTFSGHNEVVSDIAFSPDGRTALSGGHDKLLILWDVETGQEIRRFVGHTGAVNQVQFSPDARFALSAGLDNLIILWDVETGPALRRYTGHVGGVMGIAFAPDGHTFLSVALDDTVREWRVDATQEDLLIWVEANRQASEMTCQQRVQYHVEPLCETAETVP